MSFEEVVSILGPETGRRRGPAGKGIGNYADWIDGPNDITNFLAMTGQWILSEVLLRAAGKP
jgi:hypothetical protein